METDPEVTEITELVGNDHKTANINHINMLDDIKQDETTQNEAQKDKNLKKINRVSKPGDNCQTV